MIGVGALVSSLTFGPCRGCERPPKVRNNGTMAYCGYCALVAIVHRGTDTTLEEAWNTLQALPLCKVCHLGVADYIGWSVDDGWYIRCAGRCKGAVVHCDTLAEVFELWQRGSLMHGYGEDGQYLIGDISPYQEATMTSHEDDFGPCPECKTAENLVLSDDGGGVARIWCETEGCVTMISAPTESLARRAWQAMTTAAARDADRAQRHAAMRRRFGGAGK